MSNIVRVLIAALLGCVSGCILGTGVGFLVMKSSIDESVRRYGTAVAESAIAIPLFAGIGLLLGLLAGLAYGVFAKPKRHAG